jgi:hypothetical protein
MPRAIWRDPAPGARSSRRRAARRLEQLAARIGLVAPQFIAGDRVVTDVPLVVPANIRDAASAAVNAAVATPDLARPAGPQVVPQASTSHENAASREQAAERQELIDDLLGHGDRARRGRWRRGAT